MSFSNWLWAELTENGYIDTDVDVNDLSIDMLLTETDLTMEDIEDYRSNYLDYCKSQGISVVDDLEE